MMDQDGDVLPDYDQRDDDIGSPEHNLWLAARHCKDALASCRMIAGGDWPEIEAAVAAIAAAGARLDRSQHPAQ